MRISKRPYAAFEFVYPPVFPGATQETADTLVKLKIEHDSKGEMLPLADLLIASIAKENGLTIVTKDKDFERIDMDKVII